MRERVNPRYALVDRELAPDISEEDARKPELQAMCRTAGWEIAAENLRNRLRAIEKRLATDHRLAESDLRELQITYQLLASVLESPVRFFSDDPGPTG